MMFWARIMKLVVIAGAVAVALFVLGFFVFAAVATRSASDDRAKADGIVVLTGGGARIEEAGRLLAEGRGRRLLISGVNRRTGPEALKRLTGLAETTFSCCVDIGYVALDTSGNADETRAWVDKHGFTSLIVVTATYHMPRSLVELGRVLPDATLVPHPVLPRDLETDSWWLYPRTARLLAAEYVKLLSSMARLAARSLLWSNGATAAPVGEAVLAPPLASAGP